MKANFYLFSLQEGMALVFFSKILLFFCRRWIGFTSFEQNSGIFSCFDFHCPSTLVPHFFFLSSLCLQELLLPVSLTRVVQAHQSRAICSEIFERQSTSFCATRKHVLVLMIVVLSSLMHPRFLNMTRECLTATFAVAR